jgi:hypothetical protein
MGRLKNGNGSRQLHDLRQSNDEALIFAFDTNGGEATPIGFETAPARIFEYARSLEAWANNRRFVGR